jgi:hypothetical protein
MNDEIWLKLIGLLECLEGTLTVNDAPVLRSFVAPGGPPAWDVCCGEEDGEGQAWVQLNSVSPSDSFPTPQTGAMRCDFAEWAVDVSIGILRCASTVDDNGTPPSSETLLAEADKVNRDRVLIDMAIRCCFLEEDDPEAYVVGSWTPLGPQGGCVGGQQQLSFSARNCGCPPPVQESE